MALFSRGKRATTNAPQTPSAPEAAAQPLTDAATPAAAEAPVEAPLPQPAPAAPIDAAPVDEKPVDVQDADAAAAASVGISLSTFRGVGASSATAAGPAPTSPASAEAPAPTETVPGLRDNVLLRDALSVVGESPSPQDTANVARQLMQGHVFLRVKGDARTLLSEGKELPLAVVNQGDAQFVLLYSSGRALQDAMREDGETDTSAMGQPVLTVLRYVLSRPYAGIVLDHSSRGARLALPREILQHSVDAAHEELTVKTTLAEPRSENSAGRAVAALMGAPLWLAANRAGDDEPYGIAESRSPDGARHLEVFSHPLEVVGMSRGDQPVPITAAQLAAALASDTELQGVVVDPAGPWILLSREDLTPLIALAG